MGGCAVLDFLPYISLINLQQQCTDMTSRKRYQGLTYAIAAVWLINGLFCKLFNLVPRHRQIVAEILGTPYAAICTAAIGCAEVLMALWILSGIKPRWNALTQIIVVAAMNILEFVRVPHLLLWGRFNSLFALLFIGIVYCHGFVWLQKIRQTS